MELFFRFLRRLLRFCRANFLSFIGQPSFRGRGCNTKIFGWKHISVGRNVSVGDGCWIEAVTNYAGQSYSPMILIGSDVSISDYTHISAIRNIKIGKGCLLGSKIYIGDHSHGETSSDTFVFGVPPANKSLALIDNIEIGENTWICDGAIILAGSHIYRDSIIAANSVVKLKVDSPALIGGIPARIIRYL